MNTADPNDYFTHDLDDKSAKRRRRLPYKFTTQTMLSLLTSARAGYSDSRAAETAGLARLTFRKWLRSDHPVLRRFFAEYWRAQNEACAQKDKALQGEIVKLLKEMRGPRRR